MAERDKNRSCSPPVPGPSSGNTGAAAGGEMAAREERDRNPHTVESLAEVFRCFICMEKLRNAHLCPHWYVGLGSNKNFHDKIFIASQIFFDGVESWIRIFTIQKYLQLEAVLLHVHPAVADGAAVAVSPLPRQPPHPRACTSQSRRASTADAHRRRQASSC